MSLGCMYAMRRILKLMVSVSQINQLPFWPISLSGRIHLSKGEIGAKVRVVSMIVFSPGRFTHVTHRILRMYERNKNHVSIIMWSLGNESGEPPKDLFQFAARFV